jgi:hypothetical protein
MTQGASALRLTKGIAGDVEQRKAKKAADSASRATAPSL